MINIQGRIYLNIKIDQKFLDNSPNVFGTVALTESVAGLFPAASLLLNDFSGQLNRQLALTDGNEVLVTVGRTPDDLNTVVRQYRVFHIKQVASGFGPQMRVNCIYDAPKFISEAANEHYVGTSSQVLQQIADKCQLYYCGPEKYNGKTLNDAQSWWNINRSRASFAQQNVARHGYMDPHSAMCAAVTSLGELRYRNLMDVIETPVDQINFLFIHSFPLSEEDKKRKVYLVDAAQAHSDAGLMNSWQNYGSTRVVHTSNGLPQIEESVDVKTSGKYLAINDQVSRTIGRARYDHSPLDCGNVNPKYERAFYQNIKQLGLFSERVSILCSEPTAVQLLDPVLYRQSFADPSETANVSDVYIVIGKTIFVKGGSYYAERIELVRMSLTEKGESNLKCAFTPDKAAASAIPESLIDPTAMGSATSLSVTAKQLGIALQMQLDAKVADAAASLAKMSSLKVAKAAVNLARTAQNVAALVEGGVAGIVSNPLGAIRTLTNATGALSQYNSSIERFSIDYMDTGTKALGYANSLLNDSRFNDALRIATLVKPGGLAENQAAITGALSLNSMTGAIFNAGRDLVNSGQSILAFRSVPGGSQALDSFNTVVRQLGQNTYNLNRGLVDMWNSCVSISSGSPIPSLIPRDNSSSVYSFVRDSLSSPLTYEAKVKSPSDVKADFVKAITTKNDDRTLKWADLGSYVNYSATQAAARINELANSLQNRAVLYQSQQAMSYA